MAAAKAHSCFMLPAFIQSFAHRVTSLSTSTPWFRPEINQRRTLIIDTDAGFDDLLAISALKKTNSANIIFLSTVGGIQSSPSRAARYLNQVLNDDWEHSSTSCNSSVIVESGQRSQINISTDQSPDAWLKRLRSKLDNIMNSVGVSSDEEVQGKDNTQLNNTPDEVAKVLMKHADQSIDLMCLGPMTNIASWIECKETRNLLKAKINEVWIMGGNIPAENSSASNAEFNFAQDPAALFKVMKSGVFRKDQMYILPADTCHQYTPSDKEWKDLVEKGKQGDGIISQIFNENSAWYSLKFDALCAFAYARSHCRKVAVNNFKIDECSGLLYHPDLGGNDYLEANFVTDVTMDSDDAGFFNWLDEAIEAHETAKC